MSKEQQEGPSAGEIFRKEYGALAGARDLASRLNSDNYNTAQLAQDDTHDFAKAHFGIKGENRLSAKQYNLAQKAMQKEAELRTYGHLRDNLEEIVHELPAGGLGAIVHGLKPVKLGEDEEHAEQHNSIYAAHEAFNAITDLNTKFANGKVSPDDYAGKVSKLKTAQVAARLGKNKYTAGDEGLQKLWKSLTEQIVTYGDVYAQRVGQQLQAESFGNFEAALKAAEEHGYDRSEYARHVIALQSDVAVNADQVASAYAAQDKLNKDAEKKK